MSSMAMQTRFQSLVDVLRFRAEAAPSRAAYTFLEEGRSEGATITYAELDRRARSLAATLARSTQPGARCLLLHAPGLDFVCAYLGCLYAGRIAVPLAYPASLHRLDAQVRAMLVIAEDCGASALLTTTDLIPM